MAQDTTPAIVCYQGTGSQTTFDVPFDKGYYGEVKVLFVRRGLADYTYYPSEDDYVVNGRLYAWINGTTKVYTHTPNPAVSAVIYTDEDVAPVTSITLKDLSDNETIYTRSAEDDALVRRLYAWKHEDTIVYTNTPTPTLSSVVMDYQWHELALRIVSFTNIVVSAIAGQTITVDDVVYSRAVQHDISDNLKLTWNGDMLEVGDFICIIRDTERGQPYILPNNQKHIERALDNLERQIQEVKDATDVSLKVDPSYDIEDSHKMNPVAWLETILRCVDKSVRALRYANGWLDYSFDDPNVADADKTWNHLLNTTNVKDIHEVVTIDPDTQEEIRNLYYTDKDGDTHKILLTVKMEDLTDVSLNNLQANQFLMYDGLHWKNVYSSAIASWGTIIGNITDQTDLVNYISNGLSTKVNIDGTSIMTGVLKFTAGSMRGAVGPYLNGVSFWKMDNQGSLTNIANITDNQFYPVSTNSINLGRTANAWKDLYLGGKAYVATINNGADLSVPNKSGTLATTADVELAARSGRMLTDQGVWYAKMYSATVAPSAEDGTNYADFSQVDSDNNPIIVIYTRTSGAWVQSEIITPPADYDGYVPVTSKIWDIAEQSGQQGGRVLWNHTSKEFTPYPTIISFEDIEVTGDSTVIMPLNPSGNQIVNKDYVDSHVPTGGYHPSLFAHEWDDKLRDDMQWLRADTFSWQQGSVYKAAYKHLRNDTYNWYSWENNGTTIYTKKAYPEVGEKAYSNSALTTEVGEITAVTDTLDITVEKITVNNVVYDSVSGSNIAPTTETVGGVTVQYIPAEDGHKIVTDFHESEVADVYTATGVAWYYIIDYGFKRFKLPRINPDLLKASATAPVVTNNQQPIFTNGNQNGSLRQGMKNLSGYTHYMYADGVSVAEWSSTALKFGSESGLQVDLSGATGYFAGAKYLYFYVGSFTQEAIENTAGLNAELFNGKADVEASNITSVGQQRIVHWAMPDYSSGISLTFPFTAPSDGFVKFNVAGGEYGGITINGSIKFQVSGGTFGETGMVPVAKGDVITSNDNNDGRYFFPCKCAA